MRKQLNTSAKSIEVESTSNEANVCGTLALDTAVPTAKTV